MRGFWCHLEYDINTSRSELRLLLDTDDELIPLPIHVGPWTVTEAIDRVMDEAQKQAAAAKTGVQWQHSMADIQVLAASINPLISLILYVCSDEPEIDDERIPGSSPTRPTPTRTRKRGWRLFPAEKPRIWTVGTEIGERLRQADGDAREGRTTEGTGRTVKSHIRAGHWHGFWCGPLEGDRDFFYKWLPPMIVGGGD